MQIKILNILKKISKLIFLLSFFSLAACSKNETSVSPYVEQYKIKDAIYTTLQNKNALRSIDFMNDKNGNFMILVQLNGDDNLDLKTLIEAEKKQMAKIYYAAYMNSKKISAVRIKVYIPASDKYGIQFDDLVFETELGLKNILQIDWSDSQDKLVNQIIPLSWKTISLPQPISKTSTTNSAAANQTK